MRSRFGPIFVCQLQYRFFPSTSMRRSSHADLFFFVLLFSGLASTPQVALNCFCVRLMSPPHSARTDWNESFSAAKWAVIT